VAEADGEAFDSLDAEQPDAALVRPVAQAFAAPDIGSDGQPVRGQLGTAAIARVVGIVRGAAEPRLLNDSRNRRRASVAA
jgi:hypothetical protein